MNEGIPGRLTGAEEGPEGRGFSPGRKGDLSRRNLLVIANGYLMGLKDLTDTLSLSFRETHVLVRYNPLMELTRFVPAGSYSRYRKDGLIDPAGSPGNLHLYPCPVWYLPLDWMMRGLGRRQCARAEQLIADHRLTVDLIHAHFTWPMGYTGVCLAEKHGIPCVVSAHGFDIYELPFRDSDWGERVRSVLDRCSWILTDSWSNMACIERLGVKTPATVMPNGFSQTKFFPRETGEVRAALHLPPDKKILLTVGNLLPVKGHVHLIDAMERITREQPDVLSLVIGQGPLKGSLARTIRNRGLEDSVRLIEVGSHSQIPLWMNACDLFVLPSLNEGNPVVMFEALGCGKPFIGSNVGGIPDVITSPDYGLLAPPGDPAALADRVLEGLGRHWDREAIARYARNYTWDAIAARISGIYRQLLA
jgi:glycosyltransferase involved in cell wall biosynthesis